MTVFPERANDLSLQLVCARTVSFLDSETLLDRVGREALFRRERSFVLYMSDGALTSHVQERLVGLTAREALIWLNEQDAGAFWV